ncbi:hypothetical protein ACGFNX_27185 [Streptomyces sp. NPDC048723]
MSIEFADASAGSAVAWWRRGGIRLADSATSGAAKLRGVAVM